VVLLTKLLARKSGTGLTHSLKYVFRVEGFGGRPGDSTLSPALLIELVCHWTTSADTLVNVSLQLRQPVKSSASTLYDHAAAAFFPSQTMLVSTLSLSLSLSLYA